MKYKKLGAVLIIWVMVCSFCGLTTAKETVIREGWAVLEHNENPVGYSYDQLRQTDKGFIYVSEITMQTSVLGTPAKISKHMELTVDKQYLAQRSSVIIDTNGSKTSFKTDFNKDGIKMVVTSSDGKETPSVFKSAKPVYFQVSLLDSLIAAKRITPSKEYGAAIWDLNTMAPADCKIKVNAKKTYSYGEKTIPVFEVQSTSCANNSTSLIDAKGDTYWGEDPRQKLISYKIEKDQIPELQAMLTDMLLVPWNIIVPQPFQSESSTIKVTWKDFELSDFQLEDNRQKLAQPAENAAKNEVTLTIQRDNRDFTRKVVLPISDAQFSIYLGESSYINPALPEVQKIKEEILAGETDGWVATQKILAWVFQYIHPELIPQTLSTEEILAQKRGRDVEYAILFASLARAAKLPTRLAWGERYQDGAWVGHMWNEVWLGEWISIDASHNQSAPDALLLKFADSDTVMGTQVAYSRFVGQLGINIENVKFPRDETTPSVALKTGIADNVYTNAEFHLRIEVPAGWKMIETKEEGMPLLVMQNPDDPNTGAILVLASAPSGTTTEQILNSRIQLTQASVEGFSLIRQGQGTLGGSPIGESASGENTPAESALNQGDGFNQGATSSEITADLGSLSQDSSANQGDSLNQGDALSQDAAVGAYPASFATWSFSYQGFKTCQEIWLLLQHDFLYLLVFTAPDGQWEANQSLFHETRAKFQIL